MKVQFTIGYIDEVPVKTICLNRLVARLLVSFQPVAVLQKSFIVNDIPAGFQVNADKGDLLSVISYLLSSVIRKSPNSCIRVSAKRYNNIVLLRLKETNTNINHTRTFEYNWQQVNHFAEKLGGCIVVNELLKTSPTVTFSFRSLEAA